MKRSTPIFLLASLFLLITSWGFGQTVEVLNSKIPQNLIRCGTMESMEQNLKDPAFRAQYEKGIKDYENSLTMRTGSTSRTSTLTAPVTIPVVVHIVLPNPNIITETDIDYFLNRLNLDYSGLNQDSANGAPFYPVRGHSLIRFTRARRDPNGNLTSGVERKSGNIIISSQTTYQTIKHTSQGGLDPWNITQYYNLWVGVGDPAVGLLGISPAIGPGNQTETTTSTTGIDGICVDYTAFSNSCFALSAFKLARTSVHEIGHNFGLYHTFQGGCAVQSDFGQLTTANCQLPATLLGPADDTPLQSASTSGCPTGTAASGCTGTTLGKMYQNYMDYTDDPCYSMFTKGQVERMHWVLENCRPGYLTTQGGIPPAGSPALDAAPVDVVSPGGFEFISPTCTPISYPSLNCPGTIIPRVRINNRGTTTLTSVKVGFSLNGGTPQEITTTVNLPTNYSAVVAFSPVAVPAGTNTLKYWTAAPNGGVDQVPSNDTLTLILTVTGGRTLPITEDFSSATFPPPGWSLVQTQGAATASWVRSTATNGGAPGSALANFFSIGSGNKIDLRTPIISTASVDSIVMTFDVAHRQYNAVQDTLQVWVSADCGTSFLKIFEQSSSQLNTSTPVTGDFTNPTGFWKTYRIALPSAAATNILASSNIIFAFRGASNYGNRIFLDNVNISPIVLPNRDIRPVAFIDPFTTVCDGNNNNNVRPVLQVTNLGKDTIKSFVVTYTIDNGAPSVVNFTGAVPKTQTVAVQLNVASFTVGTHTIKAWTSSPNGLPDQAPANDTTTFTFQVIPSFAAPLVEGFESTTFPPANWQITQQPVDGTTWTRTTQAARTGVASAFVNNYNYAANGNIDNLISPSIFYSGADSVFMKFDVSASTYSFPGSTAVPLDTLEVLVTRDCGRTYTSLYKKFGNELQTIGDPNNPNTDEFFPRLTTQWRHDSVNVTRLLGSSSSVRFAFKNTTNFENNIFLDNINFTPKVLPAALKQTGYLITPNPFRNRFVIQHYLPPTDLRSLGVFNSVGQRVMVRFFNEGMADSYMEINMDRFPAGVYTVQLMYTGKTVSQKLIKLN